MQITHAFHCYLCCVPCNSFAQLQPKHLRAMPEAQEGGTAHAGKAAQLPAVCAMLQSSYAAEEQSVRIVSA